MRKQGWILAMQRPY